jgi:hypothetical protein
MRRMPSPMKEDAVDDEECIITHKESGTVAY